MKTEFLLASGALAFALSVAAALFAARIAVRVRDLQEMLHQLPIGSTGLLAKRVESLDTKVEELGIALSELAQKVKMQRVRTAANHVREKDDAMPDPYRDPDGWRRAMNERLSRAKIGA